MGERRKETGAMTFMIRHAVGNWQGTLLRTGGRHAEKEINMCKRRGVICVIYDRHVMRCRAEFESATVTGCDISLQIPGF